MISAEQLEKLILEAVARRGRDMWADFSLGDLKNRVADAAGLVSPNAPCSDTALVDVLVSLEGRGLISIVKAVGGGRVRTYEQLKTTEFLDDLAIFQRGSFRLKLTHDGRKALDKRNKIGSSDSSDQIIFISCGQVTQEEKELGNSVARLTEELTPYRAYFAQEQSALEGVTENILKALNRAVGLIAIMHPRGEVAGLKGEKHTRGSVWVEQEIAIASFISQVKEFYAGDEIKAVIKIPYRIEEEARDRYRESLKQLVTVTVHSGDMKPQKTERPMSKLLDIW